ncbi:MAG: hypothetical protein VB050_16740 [Geobacteraceae bacterium]|nr:hypothetical protein [Geobacteraceae bacterium]
MKLGDDSNNFSELTAIVQNEISLLQDILDEYKYVTLLEKIYKKDIAYPEPFYIKSLAYDIWNRYAVPFRWLNGNYYYYNIVYSYKEPEIYLVDHEFIKNTNDKLNSTLACLAYTEKQASMWQSIGAIGLIFILIVVANKIFG